MFNRFTGFVNSAIEVLAPHVKTKEEAFRDHWFHIRTFYEKRELANVDEPISQSNIPYHLEYMVKYIKEEEIELYALKEDTGPCLEHLLERRILEELVEHAEVDVPKGMRVQVLRTFSLLIANVQARLLPEAAVRIPLHRLILLCHEAREPPDTQIEQQMKEELVKLIHTVVRHFTNHPALVDLFFEQKISQNNTQEKPEKFYIFSALLDYITSPEQINKVAREAIIITLQTLAHPDTHQTIRDFIIDGSYFCETVAERLGILYAMMPTTRSAGTRHLSNISDGVNLSSESLTGRDHDSSAVEEFFSFWNFVNAVTSAADPATAKHMITCLDQYFMEPILSTFFLKQAEVNAECSAEYLANMIEQASDPAILQALLSMVVAFDESVDMDGTLLSDNGTELTRRSSPGEFCGRMIPLLTSSNEMLSIAVLRLFDVILNTYDANVVHNLILSGLSNESENNGSKLDLRGTAERLFSLMPLEGEMSDSAIPSTVQTGAYDDYLLEAQGLQAYALTMATRSEVDRALHKKDTGGPPNHSNGIARKLSSDFLHQLLELLRSILGFPFQKSLLLTGMLCKIVAVVDCRIDGLIYRNRSENPNPMEGKDNSEECDCIYNIMAQLTKEARNRATQIPEFERRFQFIRKGGINAIVAGPPFLQLPPQATREGGTNTDSGIATLDHSPSTQTEPSAITPSESPGLAASEKDSASVIPDPLQDQTDNTNFVYNYIVLQEFCKELSAAVIVRGECRKNGEQDAFLDDSAESDGETEYVAEEPRKEDRRAKSTSDRAKAQINKIGKRILQRIGSDFSNGSASRTHSAPISPLSSPSTCRQSTSPDSPLFNDLP